MFTRLLYQSFKKYMICRFIYIIFITSVLSFLFFSCADSPVRLLEQAEKLWGHKMDSVNIYLSQIEDPHLLQGHEKMRYCYLKGMLEFYSSEKKSDSLFAEARKEAVRLSDSAYIKKLMIRDVIRFTYKGQPDSVLNTIDEITGNIPQFADSLWLRFLMYRNESLLKKNRYRDVINETKTIGIEHLKSSSDSSLYIRVMMQMMDAYAELHNSSESDSIYTYIVEKYIAGDENYISDLDYVRRHYLSKLEKQERWREALKINTLLDEGNKEKVARNYYLAARMYEKSGMQDSAVYYYKCAEQGYCPLVASLASKRLKNYFLLMRYDEEAYKSMQKAELVENDVESNILLGFSIDKFKQTQLENELYQIRIKRQEQKLMLLVLLLIIAVLIIMSICFYFRIRREHMITAMKIQQDRMEKEAKILKYHNDLLKKESEIVVLRESLLRRLSFYGKLPSLAQDKEIGEKGKKIILTEDEWQGIKQAVDTSFNKFSERLHEAYPSLTTKDIYFCCLVKLNVNIQDLSDIYCVSKSAISKRKFRIKTEKLKIEDENTSLDLFLRDF